MARVFPQELHYAFQRVLNKHLKGKTASLAMLPEIIPELVEQVPSEAYEPRNPADAGLLFFHGDVTESSVTEMQSEIMSAHLGLRKGLPLRLMLSSLGGQIYCGLALISTIQEVQRAGRDVNIHVQGVAWSMGSIVLQAGTTRTIEPYAWLMIHEGQYEAEERRPPTWHRSVADAYQRIDDVCTALYSARTGKPVEYYKRKIEWRPEWYLTAEEALAERLVDEIVKAPAYRKKRTTKEEKP